MSTIDFRIMTLLFSIVIILEIIIIIRIGS